MRFLGVDVQWSPMILWLGMRAMPWLEAIGLIADIALSKAQGKALANELFLCRLDCQRRPCVLCQCVVFGTLADMQGCNCIPACFARLTRPTGLGLSSDCCAIPMLSGPRQRGLLLNLLLCLLFSLLIAVCSNIHGQALCKGMSGSSAFTLPPEISNCHVHWH